MSQCKRASINIVSLLTESSIWFVGRDSSEPSRHQTSSCFTAFEQTIHYTSFLLFTEQHLPYSITVTIFFFLNLLQGLYGCMCMIGNTHIPERLLITIPKTCLTWIMTNTTFCSCFSIRE